MESREDGLFAVTNEVSKLEGDEEEHGGQKISEERVSEFADVDGIAPDNKEDATEGCCGPVS